MHLSPASLMMALFSMTFLAAMSYAEETENNGSNLLKNCQVAVEYLDNNEMADDTDVIEAVKFCDDYLTGFREGENIKDMHMPGYYHRGYCFPYSGITNAELARVIVNYLQSNEYEQKLAANVAIKDAVIDGYPCSN